MGFRRIYVILQMVASILLPWRGHGKVALDLCGLSSSELRNREDQFITLAFNLNIYVIRAKSRLIGNRELHFFNPPVSPAFAVEIAVQSRRAPDQLPFHTTAALLRAHQF